MVGRSPGEEKGWPLQYSSQENSMDCIFHGVTKSWTWLSDFHFHFQFMVNFIIIIILNICPVLLIEWASVMICYLLVYCWIQFAKIYWISYVSVKDLGLYSPLWYCLYQDFVKGDDDNNEQKEFLSLAFWRAHLESVLFFSLNIQENSSVTSGSFNLFVNSFSYKFNLFNRHRVSRLVTYYEWDLIVYIFQRVDVVIKFMFINYDIFPSLSF